jgi:arginine decarboxylase
MKLYVSTAIGRGSTELSAFDAALIDAGVANFNLIRLSSVIPAKSTVERVDQSPFARAGEWGDRLYVVYAEKRTSTPGEQVWAGVGWAQDASTGRGLFVEHEGRDRDQVCGELDASLHDLQRNRGLDRSIVETSVIGAMCTGMPTCALVICAYGTSPWPAEGQQSASVADERSMSVRRVDLESVRC